MTANDKNPDTVGQPDFIITDSAQEILISIEETLSGLINRTDLLPSDDEFYNSYLRLLDMYDRFQQDVTSASGITVLCSAGCSDCCCHWVEDVNSFEAIIISRYIADHHPEIIEPVIYTFREDAEVFASLRGIVDQKLAENTTGGDDVNDPYDLLLSCFYQIGRKCVLSDENGYCIIYPVRPLTCRDYLNLRDPGVCSPDRINDEEAATLILHPPDTITRKLDELHRRFCGGSDDMSFRTQLSRCLEYIKNR